jgi:hypothetical protein
MGGDDHPLYTSDHLAVCAVIKVNPIQTWKDITEIPRVNWGKAATDQPGMEKYQRAIDGMIRPLIGKTYDSTAQVEQEVNLVMTGVCKFAKQLVPLHKKNTSKKRFRDSELQRLCEDSKQMWSELVDASRPTT